MNTQQDQQNAKMTGIPATLCKLTAVFTGALIYGFVFKMLGCWAVAVMVLGSLLIVVWSVRRDSINDK